MKISPAPSFPVLFPRGKTSLSLSVEDVFSFWKKAPLPKIFWVKPPERVSEPPSPEALLASLSHPIHHLPFRQWLHPEKKLLIVLPDHTRKTGMEALLPHLLSLLPDSLSEIGFLVATGSHHSSREMLEPLYPSLLSSYPFHIHSTKRNHWWKAGYTSSGTPVEVHPLLKEFPRVLLLGSITFHYFAGYTGGRKLIVPGLASYSAISHNHRLVWNPRLLEKATLSVIEKNWRNLKNPDARAGEIRHNPVHQDLMESCQLIAPKISLYSIQSVHPVGQAMKILAGDWQITFSLGARSLRKANALPFRKKFDCVLASAGGYPFDLSLYQAHKAIDTACRFLKKGGWLIFAAELSGHPDPPSFEYWLHHCTPQDFSLRFSSDYEHTMHTAYSFHQKASNFHFIFLSSLPEEKLRKIGILSAKNFPDALRLCISLSNKPIQEILLLPHPQPVLPLYYP